MKREKVVIEKVRNLDEGTMIYSFDVFDTIITRRTAIPSGIFCIMQDKLKHDSEYEDIPVFIKDNFYVLRKGAEELARLDTLRLGKREITFHDIYRALSTTANLTKKQLELIQNLEFKTEMCNIVGIESVISKIKHLLRHNKRVILISDMYLSGEMIRILLVNLDPVFRNIPIYVSSDYGATKADGTLYAIIKRLENLEYCQWIHEGDNEYSDILQASRLGIHAISSRQAAWKDEEKKLLFENERDFYWQLSLGSTRCLNLMQDWSLPGRIGGGIGGPVLYPYICWVLEESIRKKIDRLYFIARDGWILKQIADQIIRQRGYCLKTGYIYGSRKVWRVALFRENEDIGMLMRYSNLETIITIDDFAAIFQISREELIPFLGGLPDSVKDSKVPFTETVLNRLKTNLINNGEFKSFLSERHSAKYELAKDYLQQEIDISDSKFAFVELAGTGVTQSCLAKIMNDFCNYRIRSFYLKLDGVQICNNCDYFNFYPSNRKRSYIIELLCRAPHGQTDGYKKKDNKIAPILEDKEGQYLTEYGIEEYRDALLKYVEMMETAQKKNNVIYGSKLEIVYKYMKWIAEYPDDEMLDYFGGMPFSVDGRNKKKLEFAPVVSCRQLRNIFFWREEEPVSLYYKGASLDYSLLRSGKMYECSMKRYIYARNSRWGAWIRKWKKRKNIREMKKIRYFCPWEWLEGTVVIYGAGKVGQSYYRQITKCFAKQYYRKWFNPCEKVILVDTKYEECRIDGIRVEAPEILKEIEFNRVIIAVRSQLAAKEILDKLHSINISNDKIFCWYLPEYR